MSKTPSLVLVLTGLILSTASCAGESTATDTSADLAEADPFTVLLIGDSIAEGAALPLTEAFAQAGARFQSLAAVGGGNVVGPFAEENWAELPTEIAEADADVVLYQLTTYDWGTREEQEAGYERLSTTVTEADAELIFVTAPPIRPDDFYEPHMADLERAPEAARAVAQRSEGRAIVLDAQEVWGAEYSEVREGKPDRNPDGIHLCPQGAARHAQWLLTELADRYPTFAPPPAEEWANSGWSGDDHFGACAGE
ncbi:SGNH/GDSL hydrolase family protein [Actinoalloteichus hymeniacidonis]|uniref:Lysophospholipase L1-like esterase n=1 Tax=Actinoalloteichus hymeniacidonis TaxID=340345 RepID=A0AAC9HMA0_9PSEU|nr:SGNH/GDSL hydrolase family protein [Actinoalloteichus hymeniacidonis]AOS61932.1 lysophospholipase L1-like esterase [Actinoalloteichus hymeniacidonis]MBB5910048.1 hypothetical protein [Actinoalloteichus hymeniacidonis]